MAGGTNLLFQVIDHNIITFLPIKTQNLNPLEQHWAYGYNSY